MTQVSCWVVQQGERGRGGCSSEGGEEEERESCVWLVNQEQENNTRTYAYTRTHTAYDDNFCFLYHDASGSAQSSVCLFFFLTTIRMSAPPAPLKIF